MYSCSGHVRYVTSVLHAQRATHMTTHAGRWWWLLFQEQELTALEHDKCELLHQMKHDGLRPNMKKLSNIDTINSSSKMTFATARQQQAAMT